MSNKISTPLTRLLQKNIERTEVLYYQGKPRSRENFAVSLADAFPLIRHALAYGPTTIDATSPTRITLSRYPTDTSHLSFIYGNRRVIAERQQHIFTGDEAIMRPLLEYLFLAAGAATDITIDINPPHNYQTPSHLPALLLLDYGFYFRQTWDREIVKNYGIDAKLLQHLKKRMREIGIGSWLHIADAVELWMDDPTSSLREWLFAI